MKTARPVFMTVLIGFCIGAKLPSTFKKCALKDPKFQACFTNSVQNVFSQLDRAHPEVGLVSFEPLEIPLLTIPAGNGAVAVEQKFTDLKLTGISKIDAKEIQFDNNKKIFRLKGISPSLVLKAHYDANGKILLLPIQGNGPSTITLTKPSVAVELQLTEHEKNGNKHFKVVDSRVTLDPQKAHFNFENLFNGDKELGDNINSIMNDNWSELFADVKQGYESAFAVIFKSVLNNFFSKVPLKELFDNGE